MNAPEDGRLSADAATALSSPSAIEPASQSRPSGLQSTGASEWAAKEAVWQAAAVILGWEWSPAYSGYIRPDYHPNGPGHRFDSRPSELDAESACFISDSLQTVGEAIQVITTHENDGLRDEDAYFHHFHELNSGKFDALASWATAALAKARGQ